MEKEQGMRGPGNKARFVIDREADGNYRWYLERIADMKQLVSSDEGFQTVMDAKKSITDLKRSINLFNKVIVME